MTPYEKEVQNMHLIKEWLQVDPSSPTGLAWKKQANHGRTRVGRHAGSPEGKGYYRVILNKIPFKCHRLVLWLMGNTPAPNVFCDHINPINLITGRKIFAGYPSLQTWSIRPLETSMDLSMFASIPRVADTGRSGDALNLAESKCFTSERTTRLTRLISLPWPIALNTIGIHD